MAVLTHRDPTCWQQPDTFDPDRFRADRFTPVQKKAYYPFGKGQRLCIGCDLSLMEARLILSMVAQRFERTLPSGHQVIPCYALSLQPKDGLPLFLHPK